MSTISEENEQSKPDLPIDRDKAMRISWLKHFEPEKLSKTKLRQASSEEFNGGDEWLNEK